MGIDKEFSSLVRTRLEGILGEDDVLPLLKGGWQIGSLARSQIKKVLLDRRVEIFSPPVVKNCEDGVWTDDDTKTLITWARQAKSNVVQQHRRQARNPRPSRAQQPADSGITLPATYLSTSPSPSLAQHTPSPSLARHTLSPSLARHTLSPSLARHTLSPSLARHTLRDCQFVIEGRTSAIGFPPNLTFQASRLMDDGDELITVDKFIGFLTSQCQFDSWRHRLFIVANGVPSVIERQSDIIWQSCLDMNLQTGKKLIELYVTSRSEIP
jgi:hypothetical protein